MRPSTPEQVLVVNAGSSSVKLRLLGAGDTVLRQVDLDAERGRFDPAELDGVVRRLAAGGVDAVGHRIVHGGTEFTGPVVLTEGVLAAVERLGTLAPLHQPPAVSAARVACAALPEVTAVACFDTAFHAGLPPAASSYAIPRRWRAEFGVRRYGFHGLAHEWGARRAAELLGVPQARLRTVVAHLGSGASLCAVDRGRSVDTTMGFTPTAGLVMGTRCGDLDPAVPLWLVARRGLDVGEVADALDRRSGLVGLTGMADMREVLAAQQRGDPEAELGIGVWLHRLGAQVAAMAAAMGGLDTLVFSGGVGENIPQLRQAVATRLAFLGLALDPAANAAGGSDRDVSAPGAPVRTLVVHTREDVVIAGQVRRLLTG
jgi:acetate kinase